MLTHQYDAVRCHEWRMIPPLSTMEDGLAQRVFIITHFPMLVLIFLILTQPDGGLKYNYQLITDIIMTGHIGKHIFLNSHEKNEFKDSVSKTIIFFVSAFALLHLLILLNFISL